MIQPNMHMYRRIGQPYCTICTYRILYVQVEIWYDPSPVPFPPAHPPPKGCVAVDAPGPRMAGQRILKCRHRSTGCFKMCSVPFSKGLCPNIRCAQLWPVSIVSIGNINSPVIHQWFTSDSPVNLGKNHSQPRKIWPAFAAAAIARQAGRSMSSAWWLNEQ